MQGNGELVQQPRCQAPLEAECYAFSFLTDATFLRRHLSKFLGPRGRWSPPWDGQFWGSKISKEQHLCLLLSSVRFGSVQSLSRVRLFVTPWIAACQASLSITNSRSSLRFTSIESVMPSSHLILCYPLLLLPPIPPSIRVFSNESTLRMRWPKYWSFSFCIIPSKEHPGLISFRMV